MASNSEDQETISTLRLADPLPSVQNFNSAKTTAVTEEKQPKNIKIPQKSPQLRQELLNSAIPEHFHNQLGYRSVTAKEAFELVGHNRSGWVVPFKDPEGKHFLTRKGKPFYRLKPDEGEIKYLSPSEEGCRPYFSPLLELKHFASGRDIFITEGEKKSDCLVAHGFPAIGLSGVWCWKDHRSGGSKMLPELIDFNWKRRNVFVVFDSDILDKLSVKDAYKSLKTALEELGATVKIIPLPPELNGEKNGVDDFIFRHGKDAFKKLIKAASDNIEEPKQTHFKALIALPIIKTRYSLRPDIGLYEFSGTHWERQKEKKASAIELPLHEFMDQMRWNKRESFHFNSVRNELLAYLKNTEWDQKPLLSFKNGTLNVETNKFSPKHQRDDYLTHSFDFNYDPKSTCPTWLKFLDETFQKDHQIIQLLRAAFKWSVLPKDSSKAFELECFFDLYGEKGCGKGTIQEVLTAVCGGDKARGLLRSSNIGSPEARASLLDKKLAIDPDASGFMNDAGVFNSIVSNEPVDIKILYENTSLARLGVVVWRNFNDQPSVSGGGAEGLGRRMVTFRIKNQPTRPDPKLKGKLLKEVTGIFQWCWCMSEVEMIETFKRRGDIKAIAEASVENQLEHQPILKFLKDNFQDGESYIRALDLYERDKKWCEKEGRKPCSNAKFGKEVKKVKGLVFFKQSNTARTYTIEPTKDFDWAVHFGIKQNVGLNPTQNPTLHSNPTPPDPLEADDSQGVVQGVYGLSNNFNFKKEKDITYKGKESSSTQHTLHTQHQPIMTITDQVEEARAAGHQTVNEILKYAANKNRCLGKSEVERCLKRQGKM